MSLSSILCFQGDSPTLSAQKRNANIKSDCEIFAICNKAADCEFYRENDIILAPHELKEKHVSFKS